MAYRSTYDKFPVVSVESSARDVQVGWAAIVERLRGAVSLGARRIAVECYPGTYVDEIARELTQGLRPGLVVRTELLFRSPKELNALFARDLTDDLVFGRMNGFTLLDFFDPTKLAAARGAVAAETGTLLVVGSGATLVLTEPDIVVYADLARWEIQMRQRAGKIANLGADNLHESPALRYKRGFFIDWRAADRQKKKLLPRLDFLLDTNDAAQPKMITGEMLRRGLAVAARRPFRVVPFFDPAPWGGQWMKEVCDLPRETANYGWCFDCVPEENSLLLGFGEVTIEIPSIDLVFSHPRELLGDAVHARFGAEFPIRFDFLDTMEGGNLSFQVHPLTEYIQDKFGMNYTQDESYYLLDAKGDGCVYLGMKENIDRAAMVRDLWAAQRGEMHFPAAQYVNIWPAKKHDHCLIPAGTPHCSGRNSMVLEISATPYIFTFKMWDWGRLGLDGLPRPIHLEHGINNIQWDRTTAWVERELVNRVTPVARGDGWCEERTGLHEREFIETRRHWFTGAVPHNTGGGVNVFNLVEGEAVAVESPAGAFDPFIVHYAETFIVPAAVGDYTVRPLSPVAGRRHGTIKAFVRTRA